MKNTKIEVNNEEVLVSCPHCGNWEIIGIDEQRHHLKTITVEKWLESDSEHEESLMKCQDCKKDFTLTWDYNNKPEEVNAEIVQESEALYPIDEINKLTLPSIGRYSKEDVVVLSNELIKEIQEDGADVIDIVTQLTRLSLLSETILKSDLILEMVEGYLATFDKNKNTVNGVRLAISKTARYDYSNDEEWAAMNAKLKEREKFLKGLSSRVDTVDDDGVLHTAYPPVKKEYPYIKKELL